MDGAADIAEHDGNRDNEGVPVSLEFYTSRNQD